ncbi:MAG: alginate export family protein [Gemmatimonadota bacterium]
MVSRLLPVLALLAVLPPADAQAQVLVPGQGVSVDIRLGEGGSWIAEDIEVLSRPRSLSLRGPIEALDVEGSRLKVLGRWIRFGPDSTTFVPARQGASLAAFEQWEWMEVKLTELGTPEPVAARVDLYAKTSRTVKGTVTAVNRAAGRTVLYVNGFPIEITRETDVDDEAGGMFTELFGELKSEDLIGDDPGYRQIGSNLFVSGSLRPIAQVQSSFSLAENSDDVFGIGEPSARAEMMAVLPGGAKLFAQGQLRTRYELYRTEDVLADEVSTDPEVQLRQLYVSAPSLLDLPIGVTAGKQRVRDNREFLFDEYLDGLRVYAYPLQPLVLEASFFAPVVPLRDRYETWKDLLLQARWFVGDDWRTNVYMLRRSDTDEARGRNVRYYGASLEGKHDFLKVWGNGALLRGEDKGRAQDAYAWDVGVALRARHLALQPGVSLSRAKGSGDRDGGDATSNEFRQSGYHDNSSRVWGLASFRHFGEALDPELSNLNIVTASVGIRTASRFSLDLVGHQYWLVELTDQLDNVDLETSDTPLSGGSYDVGYGADVVLALRDVFPGTHFTYKLGAFVPGDAFENSAGLAWLHKLEFRIDF